ncbi:hypothetical protein J5X84_26270 [Streptosporangiaceae bacterium NEAU-GS5]|nr:hypothetical protein [Streptosporangiaceae bacterium NEAU-GS5]
MPVLTGLPPEPFLLAVVFGAQLGAALLISRWTGGPGAGRRLLSGVLRWRAGWTRWLTVLFAMPALTVAVGAATGTLYAPAGGWAMAAVNYLFQAVVLGALLFNVWEETAWSGFVQSRLMARHGLLYGALLTAPMFVVVHLPLLFGQGWTWSSVAISLAALVVSAPFFAISWARSCSTSEAACCSSASSTRRSTRRATSAPWTVAGSRFPR